MLVAQQEHLPVLDYLVCYTAIFSVVTQRCREEHYMTTLKTAVDATIFEPCVYEVLVQPSSTFYVLRNGYCNKNVHFMGILCTWHFLVQMYP